MPEFLLRGGGSSWPSRLARTDPAPGRASSWARARPRRRHPSPCRRPLAAGVTGAAASRVVVDVVGAVRRPGLYRLAQGSRIADAVARAGGATRQGRLAQVNLAAPLADGEQVVVPRRGAGARRRDRAALRGRPRCPVHLSTATLEQLDALPGVGPVTAQKIVDYRQEHGAFHSVDELDADPGHRAGAARAAARAGRRRERAGPLAARATRPRSARARRREPARRGVDARPALCRCARCSRWRSPARPASLLRRGARAARLVVGQRAPRRARPQRAAAARRHVGRARASRSPAPPRRSGSSCACRRSVRRFGRLRSRERGAARAPARPLAAAGRPDRAARPRARCRAGLERLRRAHLAAAPRRARRPARRRWRQIGRRGGLGGVADRLRARARAARSRPGSTGERRAVVEGIVLGDDAGALGRGCASASARPGSTTCWRSRARTSCSSRAARSRSRGCSGSRAGSGSSARSRRSPRTCSPSDRSRR